MNDDIRSEQFNQALDDLLAGKPAAGEFQPLLELARLLRGMPAPDLKDRLWADLQRRTTMTATMTLPTTLREGFHTVTPFLMARNGPAFVEFLKSAFGAQETFMKSGEIGMHAELKIGDTMVMVGGGGAMPEKSTGAYHIFVDDPDATYQRALQAGATSLGAVEDRHYGERSGFVEDPFGNYWYIAKPLAHGTHFKGLRSVNPYLHPSSARGLMDFLKKAFDAEELAFFEQGGRVAHAQARIGDSVVEMGEGPPRPASLYIYVEDPDAVYRAALAAGATSVHEPKDQAYGERNATVLDPYGNHWLLGRTLP